MANESLSPAAQTLLGVQDESPTITEDTDESPEVSVNSQDESPDTEEQPQGQETEPEAVTFQKLLETAGSPEEFYSIELPVGAGEEPITLGQAKDAAKEAAGLQVRRAAQDVAHQDRENEVLAKLRDLATLHESLPEQARSPEIQQKLTEMGQQRLQREQHLLIQALPDWKEPTVAAKEKGDIATLLRSYGKTDAEIAHLDDHRDVKLLRDFAALRALLQDTAKAEVKKPRKNPTNKGQPRVSKDKVPGATEGGLALLTGLRK